jgi:hypothetical protein
MMVKKYEYTKKKNKFHAPSETVRISIAFYVVLLKIIRKYISGIYKTFTTPIMPRFMKYRTIQDDR